MILSSLWERTIVDKISKSNYISMQDVLKEPMTFFQWNMYERKSVWFRNLRDSISLAKKYEMTKNGSLYPKLHVPTMKI